MASLPYYTNRKILASDDLKIPAWENVEKKLRDFNPGIIILVARRMPRLWYLRELFGQRGFENLTVISHYALPYEKNSFSGKRIAILDDSVNAGSTLKAIRQSLEGLQTDEIRCFAVFRNASSTEALNCEYGEEVEARNYALQSLKLSDSLRLINRPFELEIPVYKCSVEEDTLKEFPYKLSKMGARFRPYKIDIREKARCGLERYSLDVQPDSKFNDKFRFYLDWQAKEICIAPFAHSSPLSNMEKEARERFFIASINLMKRVWPEISTVLGLKQPEIIESDIELLFGKKKSAKFIEFASLDTPIIPLRQKTNENSSCDFYQIAMSWPEMQKIKNSKLNNCLKGFFKLLGKKTGTDEPHKLSDDLKPLLGKNADASERLRIGPTFNELCKILSFLWRPLPVPEIRRYLGQPLDEQIDQGFIVPMMGASGERIFRRGESLPYDRKTFNILRCMGYNVGITDDMDKFIEELPPQKRELYERLYQKEESGA